MSEFVRSEIGRYTVLWKVSQSTVGSMSSKTLNAVGHFMSRYRSPSTLHQSFEIVPICPVQEVTLTVSGTLPVESTP